MKTYTVEIDGTRVTILRDRDGKFLTPPGWGGMGSALKPANEPICMARKPLSESSIAANVLRHGTGAINIDGCRIGWQSEADAAAAATGFEDSRARGTAKQSVSIGKESRDGTNTYNPNKLTGRWPANLIHDGSEEVLAGFPETHSAGAAQDGVFAPGNPNGTSYKHGGTGFRVGDPGGSAARFFYTAKADADDRLGSRHPTVKPLDLIQYLIRLVTPKGGTVLDPFAGTGTAGEAAYREGFKAVLVEREEEYQADIVKRMGLCLSGPEERRRETIKHAGLTADAGPLFGGGGSMMVNRAGGTLPQGSKARKGRSVYGVFADEKGSPNE
jgi:hypothetical protein